MSLALNHVRKLLLTLLLLLCVAWVFGEAAQQLLRWHAQHLLADIRALQVNHTTWSDAVPTMQKWSRWGSAKADCSDVACEYRIDLIQTLPPLLIGSPNASAKNWLPRLMDQIGLRSAAVRAGITVEHGTVTSRWFGEQVTLPIRDWSAPDDYIPYLSVASTESAHFHDHTADHTLQHPNHTAQHVKTYLDISFSPEEVPSEQSALMDFRFNCITRFRPCHNQSDILPEALRMLQEPPLSAPSR